jgi:hypothetical protein
MTNRRLCTTRTSASGVSLPKWVEGERTVRSGQALICALAEAFLPNSLAFGGSLNVDIGTRFSRISSFLSGKHPLK